MRRPTGSEAEPRSRFARAPEGAIQLTDRDGALLCDVFLHRAMSRGQIEELHFTSPSRANRRLRILFDHGYLLRSYAAEAPYGAQAAYSIAGKAVPVVAARLGLDPAGVRGLTRKSPTPVFREHALAVVDFSLALRRDVAASPDTELVEWVPELLCRQEYEIRPKGGGPWRKEVFRPDGYFRLRDRRTGDVSDWFVEIDLGHTSSRDFAGKLASYRTFLESGIFRETFGAGSFRVLVVTPGERRAQNLREIAKRHPAVTVAVTTAEAVRTEGLPR